MELLIEEDQRAVFEQRMKREQMSRCRDMSVKLKVIFIVRVIHALLGITTVISVGAIALRYLGSNIDAALTSVKLNMIFSVALVLILGIVYGIMLLGMGKYMSEFSAAGLFTVIEAMLSAIYNYTGYNILNWAALIFAVLSLVRFSDGMKMALEGFSANNCVDRGLALQWSDFKSKNIKMLIVMGVSLVVAFIPILGLFIAPIWLVLAIAAIVLDVWQTVLVYRSSVSMNNYAPV